MASRIARTPVVQLQRHLSAQAVPALRNPSKSSGIETSVLPNGLTVASIDTSTSGTATLGIVVRAGSKYESYGNLGVSHLLRVGASLATKSHTSLSVVRNLQQLGAGLNCSQGREYMVYNTQATKDKLDHVVDFFVDAVTNPAFKPWELSDNKWRLSLDLAEQSDQSKATELLHKAAYRTGLGNSLYAPEYMLGKLKPAVVEEFYKKYYTTTSAILVGVGISHKKLLNYAEVVKLGPGAASDAPGKYFGGEARLDAGGRLANINIAYDTAGLSNPKEAVAFRLLQKILGGNAVIPYGNGSGVLSRAVAAKHGADSSAAVSALNYAYADTGLFGAFIVAEAPIAGKVLETTISTLRTLNITDAQVKAAKSALLLEVLETPLKPTRVLEDIGTSSLLRRGAPLSDQDKLDLVNQATSADVQAAAKRIAGSKLSMSAVGNLGHVPYLDSL